MWRNSWNIHSGSSSIRARTARCWTWRDLERRLFAWASGSLRTECEVVIRQEVARSPNSREGNDVGEIHRTPLSLLFVASSDRAFLERSGEPRLGDPLRGNLRGIREGGGRRPGHGRAKPARSRKRRTQPRNTYGAPTPVLLGETPGNALRKWIYLRWKSCSQWSARRGYAHFTLFITTSN
jgi:hypothetical protein